MLLEVFQSRVRELRQRLTDLIENRRNEEKERDFCAEAIDRFRKLAGDKRDELEAQYQRMSAELEQLQGTRFRREFQEKMREIVRGAAAGNAFGQLEDGVSRAERAYGEAESNIENLARSIRNTEEELTGITTQYNAELQEGQT